jgi:2-polyprenyl-3-methyl-5-hydroxy-6-metoxy-1,4-benzoquinol methylase
MHGSSFSNRTGPVVFGSWLDCLSRLHYSNDSMARSLTSIPAHDFRDLYSSASEQAKTARRTCEWTIPMLQRLGVSSGRVLSIGCASGVDVSTMRLHGYNAYGIDAYPACECAAAWCQVTTATNIPFEDGTFDAALMLEVIEHIPKSEREATARECMRVLKKSAPLIVVTPNRLFPVDEHSDRFVRLHSPFRDDTVTVSELESLFQAESTTLTWRQYFKFERFRVIGMVMNLIMPMFDSSLIHRSPLNPHLFVALKQGSKKAQK